MIGDFPQSSDLVGGGVESVMLYSAGGLVQSGEISLDVVTLDRWGLGERRVDMGGYLAHYVRSSDLPGRAKTWQNVHQMTRYLRGLEPDLIHVHIAGHYAAAARRSGLPWILTLHGVRYLEARLRTGWLNQTYRKWIIEREELRSVRSAPFIISINPFVEESFKGEFHGQIFRIENPVSDAFFELEQLNKPFSLLHVGRLTPRKDLLTLLEAFRLLSNRVPDATLRLAGACDPDDAEAYCDSLRSFTAKHKLEQKVVFLGATDQDRLLSEFARASVVVLSALMETAPMAIAEAQASSTAVVTTDAGGCRYLVDEGRTGRVVPCGDSRALANALVETLEPDGRALATGLSGHEEAERRSRVSYVVDRTLAAYRAAIL